MYAVFNELCGHEKILENNQNIDKRETVSNFIRFLKKLKDKQIIEGIIATRDILSCSITKGYSFNDWLQDELVDRTDKQFFRSFLGKYITYIKCNTEGEFYVKIYTNNCLAEGCSVAFETDTPAISVATHRIWQNKQIEGTYHCLDDYGDLLEEQKIIDNINECISNVENMFRERMFEEISSGYDLWEQREKLFPNLIFCESVKAQLYKDPERFHVLSIMGKLQRLQDYFAEEQIRYDPKKLGLNARTESECVKTSSTLNKFRLFRIPSGDELYFYDHIGFSGKFSGGRIHFYPKVEERKCYIGYIGKHLPTKLF